MTREERIAREELVALASHERGRRLLQLALRGIQDSGRGLTIGCWVKPNGGVSGCVFQHAYWQGVAEGSFAPGAAAKPEIKGFVPPEDFRLVMEAIRALDVLGKRRFLRRHGLRRVLDEGAWRDAVERLLVDALAEGVPPAEKLTAVAPA
jgi:hypothetical protein